MINKTTWSGMNPLTLRIVGSGEYVKKECANLENSFYDAMADRLEEFRQDEYFYEQQQ